jgi:hypothetical protein
VGEGGRRDHDVVLGSGHHKLCRRAVVGMGKRKRQLFFYFSSRANIQYNLLVFSMEYIYQNESPGPIFFLKQLGVGVRFTQKVWSNNSFFF